MPETRDLFRQAIAHSSPTIEDEDSFVPTRKRKTMPMPDMELVPTEHTLIVPTIGYADRFGAEIERQTGQTIELHSEVDPSIIGGLKLQVGNMALDASIQSRLEKLRREVAQAA